MMEIFAIPLVLAAGAYVVYPLFRSGDATPQQTTDADRRHNDFLHQQQMIQNTMDDLEFDVNTGKLSDADFASLASDLKKQQDELDAQMKNAVGLSSAELTARLEQEIAAYKDRHALSAVTSCPLCGRRFQAEDQFCSSCGYKIK